MVELDTRHARRHRRRRIAGTAVGVLAAVAVAGTAAVGYGRDPDADHRARRPAPPATAKVERVTLVEGRTFKGNLEYADPAPLSGRLPGTVTGLPEPGQVLRPGDTAYLVDNRPVVLMSGTMPAYRPLGVGDRGPDVRQLEENLRSLGYTGFTVDEQYTSATATAVRRWQQRLKVEQTGTVELGRVVFRPKPLRVGALRVRPGDPAGGTLYDTTGTDRRVTLSLATGDRHLAPKGGRATVIVPGGRGTAPGVVGEVAPPAAGEEPKPDATPKFRVMITVEDQKALDGYDEGPIDVRLVVGERRNVLAVPIVALLALSGDRYGVEVVEGSLTRITPVTIGLFAQGKVEISGEGIAEGTEVSVPAS